MLFRYLFGYNDEQNFTTFIRNLSIQEKQKTITQRQEMNKKENFVSTQQSYENDNSTFPLTSYLERLASFFIISGNKVSIRV
jgi:hypothetical protein